MIRWCTYCQQFIGEKEPYLDYSITHGICALCFAAESFMDEADPRWTKLGEFYAKLTRSAFDGDLDTAERLAKEAVDAGLDLIDVAMGFIQPALYEIGAKWARGEITHEDEHRFTAWSDRWLAIATPKTPPIKPHADLLIAQAPGNTHVLGPHLTTLALRKLKLDARHDPHTLSSDELLKWVTQAAPRALGFSCALPQQIPLAVNLAEKLRDNGFEGALLLGGVACRGPGSVDTPPWLGVIRNLAEVVAILT
jgi:methanogenic corrinoid protein MtbC1